MLTVTASEFDEARKQTAAALDSQADVMFCEQALVMERNGNQRLGPYHSHSTLWRL